MSSVKVSELNVLSAITSDDYFPVVDSGSATTYRATFTVLATWILGNVSASYALKSLLADTATTASYAKTASFLEYHGEYNGSASYAISSSYAMRADTASYFSFTIGGLTADNATNALSASWASSSMSSSYSQFASSSLSSSYSSASFSSSYALSSSYSLTASYASAVGGGVSIPIGAIMDYAGTSTPSDTSWRLCDGSEVNGTTYAGLATLLGTGATSLWGSAAAGNVKLPDFRRRTTFMASGSVSSPSSPYKLSGSVGNYGGSEGASQHYHIIGKSGTAFSGEGRTTDDNLLFWWVGNTTLRVNTTDPSFPQFLTPGNNYGGTYYLTGDNGGSRSQPYSALSPSDTNSSWCVGSSFAFSPSGSEMLPSYAIVNKIIKIS